ncbi:unnamed protein product [Diatraea saccharalis]|uniref:Uncharacterized protein n=1 Tax=Diatraea saccharalis TaxID=40085 RepID=A0A9N9QKN1_9NEOP|nr:unnamed protein product [Diatraea saccharalis]
MRTIIVIAILNFTEAFIGCEDICKSQRSNGRPMVCLCSLEDVIRSSTTFSSPHVKRAVVMDDSSIFYEPLELSAYSSYFLKQPFYIHTPDSIKQDNNHIYKTLKSSDNQNPLEFSSSKKIKKEESRMLGTPIETQPFFLNTDIVKTYNNQQSFGLDKHIGNVQELEQNLMDCINLHILADLQKDDKYILDSKYLNDYHFKKYLGISYSDLKKEIQSKCSHLTQVVKTSLKEIKKILTTKYIDTKATYEARAENNFQKTEPDSNNNKLNLEVFSVKGKNKDSSTSVYVNKTELGKYAGSTKSQFNDIEMPLNNIKDLIRATNFNQHYSNLISTPSLLSVEKTHNYLYTENPITQTTILDSNYKLNTTASSSFNEIIAINDSNVLENENTGEKSTKVLDFSNEINQSVEIFNDINNETTFKSTTYSTETKTMNQHNRSSYQVDILSTKYYDNRITTTTDNDINSSSQGNGKLESRTSSNYFDTASSTTSLNNQYTELHDNKDREGKHVAINNTDLTSISVTSNKPNESDQTNKITKHIPKDDEYFNTTPPITTRTMYYDKDMSNTKIETLDSINDNVSNEIQRNEILENQDLKYDNWKSPKGATHRPYIVNNNNIDLDGSLYFVFQGYSIPARFVQNGDGKMKLGIDGVSLCNKIEEKGLHDSLIISALCKCSRSDDCKVLKEIINE